MLQDMLGLHTDAEEEIHLILSEFTPKLLFPCQDTEQK